MHDDHGALHHHPHTTPEVAFVLGLVTGEILKSEEVHFLIGDVPTASIDIECDSIPGRRFRLQVQELMA